MLEKIRQYKTLCTDESITRELQAEVQRLKENIEDEVKLYLI